MTGSTSTPSRRSAASGTRSCATLRHVPLRLRVAGQATLQFARFKTHGGYAELRTDALRFTEAEIDELFRDIYNDPLDPPSSRSSNAARRDGLRPFSLSRSPSANARTPERATALHPVDHRHQGQRPVRLPRRGGPRPAARGDPQLPPVDLDPPPDHARGRRALAGVHDGRRAPRPISSSAACSRTARRGAVPLSQPLPRVPRARLIAERLRVGGRRPPHPRGVVLRNDRPVARGNPSLPPRRAPAPGGAAHREIRRGGRREGRPRPRRRVAQQLPEDTIRQNARLSLLYGEACGIRGEWDRATEVPRTRSELLRAKGRSPPRSPRLPRSSAPSTRIWVIRVAPFKRRTLARRWFQTTHSPLLAA